MTSFAFVSDAALREALQSDHREMERCFEVGAWKAVHVLAGSIVEAVLVDYLVSSGSASASKALKWQLGKLIAEAESAGAVTKKTVDLSSAVKEYRNLIHPGRKIRLGEEVTQSAATVVKALVAIIASEVEREKKETYGYTAEQLLTKLESDRSVVPLLKHLASETKEVEIERLVCDLIPQHLIEVVDREDEDRSGLSHLGNCHRQLLELAPEAVRVEFATQFVNEVKDGSSYTIQVYLDYLVRSSDLEFLDGKARSIAVDRLLAELKERIQTGPLPRCVGGLGSFLKAENVDGFVDPLARALFRGRPVAGEAMRYLEAEYLITKHDIDKKIAERLTQWETSATKHPGSQALTSVKRLIELFGKDDDLPF